MFLFSSTLILDVTIGGFTPFDSGDNLKPRSHIRFVLEWMKLSEFLNKNVNQTLPFFAIMVNSEPRNVFLFNLKSCSDIFWTSIGIFVTTQPFLTQIKPFIIIVSSVSVTNKQTNKKTAALQRQRGTEI